MNDLNYSELPEHLRGGMERWYLNAVQPGEFLTRVLNGDVTAILVADFECEMLFRQIIAWCAENLPAPCWGSRLKTKAWADAMGALGIERIRLGGAN